jgi:hypothetical protein
MLKHLAILTVLAFAAVGLLKGQTAPLGTPKQGIAKPDSSQDGKKQPETSQPQKTPIELTSADVEVEPAPCDETCQQGRRNLAIQGKLEWFTGVLAIVGILQVLTMAWQAWLLKQTREDVHTQAGHMKDQTKILGDSVKVAQASADAANAQIRTMKDKERARLTVRPISEGFMKNLRQESSILHASVRIDHYGETDAFNLRGYFTVQRGDTIIHPWNSNIWGTMAIPSVMKAGDGPLMPAYTDSQFLKQDFDDLLAEKLYLVFFGFVLYEDIFGDEHREDFDYFWFVEPGVTEFGFTGNSQWKRCGDDEDKRIGRDLKGVFPAPPWEKPAS